MVNRFAPVRRLVAACAAAFAVLLGVTMMPTPTAHAADRVVLKDGRVLEGTITREESGYIFLKVRIGGIERDEIIRPEDVKEITRDADGAPAAASPATTPATGAAPTEQARPASTPAGSAPRRPGVPRAAVITLGDRAQGDMVGLYVTADSIRNTIPLLKSENVDIVVLRVQSGGGALLEIRKIAELLRSEMQPQFQTVAWIDSAISAAAMMVHGLPDIYFMSHGNYGACTGWRGNLEALKGRGLEQVLFMMEEISAWSGRDPRIMRAMQITADPEDFRQLDIEEPSGALSATINEDGTVTWHQDATSGEYVLNPKANINVLTFNAQEAEKFRFSRGTADTIEQLGRAMGYNEIEWVGRRVQGVPWPVSRAEEYMQQFRERTKDAEERTQSHWITFQNAMQMAQGAQTREECNRFRGKARESYNQIVRSIRDNPNLMLFVLNMEQEQYDDWRKEIERALRELCS